MKNKEKSLGKGKGTIALSQIFLLVLSTIAFSFLLANSLPLVRGYGGGDNQVSNPTSTDLEQDRQPVSESEEIRESMNEAIEEGEDVIEDNEGTSFWSYLSPSAGAGKSVGHWAGYIASNAAISYGIYQITKLGLGTIGVDERSADIIGKGGAIGWFAGAIATKLTWISSAWIGFGVGAGIAILYALFTWKEERYYQVTFTCAPWDAQKGGEYCKLCNDEDIPCTEYRCMSLGTHCEYLKEEQLCVYDDRIDIKPPVIKPWEEILTEEYKYFPDNAISPPHTGVRIVPEENEKTCVSPFTPFTFGIELDKPARCKYWTSRPGEIGDIDEIKGGWNTENKLLLYNHKIYVGYLPSVEYLETQNITLKAGGEFSVYVRCQTRQGDYNQHDFVFSFCVDDGPDMKAPWITRTSIPDNSPISYFYEEDLKEINLTIYTNEPAQCRWSRLEQAYEDMPILNQVNCLKGTLDVGDYICDEITLTGLENRENNDYYISCIDKPHLEGTEEAYLRNVMQRAHPFRLIGTQPLILDSAEPNNTIIRDSTGVIKVMLKVKTSVGYDKGKSNCEFKSNTDENSRYALFLNDGGYDNYEHEQRLDLAAGDYSYDIRCVDLGGNAATRTITFTVETDTTAPTVVRAFREGEYLKIVTDEDAKCVYSNILTIDCRYDFEEGTEMDRDFVEYNTIHSLPWDSDKTFYIKCEDKFKNRPNPPDRCSITARPYGD